MADSFYALTFLGQAEQQQKEGHLRFLKALSGTMEAAKHKDYAGATEQLAASLSRVVAGKVSSVIQGGLIAPLVSEVAGLSVEALSPIISSGVSLLERGLLSIGTTSVSSNASSNSQAQRASSTAEAGANNREPATNKKAEANAEGGVSAGDEAEGDERSFVEKLSDGFCSLVGLKEEKGQDELNAQRLQNIDDAISNEQKAEEQTIEQIYKEAEKTVGLPVLDFEHDLEDLSPAELQAIINVQHKRNQKVKKGVKFVKDHPLETLDLAYDVVSLSLLAPEAKIGKDILKFSVKAGINKIFKKAATEGAKRAASGATKFSMSSEGKTGEVLIYERSHTGEWVLAQQTRPAKTNNVNNLVTDNAIHNPLLLPKPTEVKLLPAPITPQKQPPQSVVFKSSNNPGDIITSEPKLLSYVGKIILSDRFKLVENRRKTRDKDDIGARSKNKVGPPNPDYYKEPHLQIKIKNDGEITGYAVFAKNSLNPTTGLNEIKRVDLDKTSDPHINKVLGKSIKAPHVNTKLIKEKVRYLEKNEIINDIGEIAEKIVDCKDIEGKIQHKWVLRSEYVEKLGVKDKSHNTIISYIPSKSSSSANVHLKNNANINKLNDHSAKDSLSNKDLSNNSSRQQDAECELKEKNNKEDNKNNSDLGQRSEITNKAISDDLLPKFELTESYRNSLEDVTKLRMSNQLWWMSNKVPEWLRQVIKQTDPIKTMQKLANKTDHYRMQLMIIEDLLNKIKDGHSIKQSNEFDTNNERSQKEEKAQVRIEATGKMATVIEEGIYGNQDKSNYANYHNFNANSNNIINSHENDFNYECQIYGVNNVTLEGY